MPHRFFHRQQQQAVALTELPRREAQLPLAAQPRRRDVRQLAEQLLQADAELDGQYGWLSSRALAPDGKDQPMNLQRSTPYKDLASFAGPRQPAVMASFVSLFLRSSTVQRFGLPIAEFFLR